MLALRLPKKPPMVYIDVTTENVASDMGIHVGRPKYVGAVASVILHVRTACSWFKADV
jgi:hypothetical protein